MDNREIDNKVIMAEARLLLQAIGKGQDIKSVFKELDAKKHLDDITRIQIEEMDDSPAKGMYLSLIRLGVALGIGKLVDKISSGTVVMKKKE